MTFQISDRRQPHLGQLTQLLRPHGCAAQARSLLHVPQATAARPPATRGIADKALDRGVGQDGCLAAAILGLGARSEKNDLLAAMDLPQDHRLRQHTDQLLRMARPPNETLHDDEALLFQCWLAFLTA